MTPIPERPRTRCAECHRRRMCWHFRPKIGVTVAVCDDCVFDLAHTWRIPVQNSSDPTPRNDETEPLRDHIAKALFDISPLTGAVPWENLTPAPRAHWTDKADAVMAALRGWGCPVCGADYGPVLPDMPQPATPTMDLLVAEQQGLGEGLLNMLRRGPRNAREATDG